MGKRILVGNIWNILSKCVTILTDLAVLESMILMLFLLKEVVFMDNPMAQFCILYENSFKDALKKVKKWIQDKKYIPSHSHFPIENGNFQNGMPRFSETFIMADDPKNYSAIFSWQENQINQIYYKEIRGFSQLCQYIYLIEI